MQTEIALITDNPRDYGDYALEILRMEGLRAARLTLADLPSASLPQRVILAGDLPLTRAEAEALQAHASAGARLIFFAPDPFVAEAFGFAPTYRTLVDGFLRAPECAESPMQFHGALRLLRPPETAETLAEAFAECPAPGQAGAAAIVRLPIGRGEAVFFLYDLPQSVALTRQGDPRRRGLHGNLVVPGWRAADMFAGYLHEECARLPQADLQCHLLRDLLLAPVGAEAIGLPYLWPFPEDAPTALLLSSDDDWSTPEQFQALHDCVRRHKATITYYLVPETIITPEWKAAREAEGDTFSIHPVHKEPLRRTWEETVRAHRAAFRERFGAEPGPSVRNHAIAWIGYLDGAHRNLALGFTWDSNYFTCPPLTRHYMTGSGLPLPFVEENGAVLPHWQMPCQYSDETTLAAGGFEFSLKLSEEEARETIGALLRANAEQYHSMLAINTHPVSFALYSGGLWEGVMQEAARLGVPCLSLEGFARFWETRNRALVGATEQTEEGYSWLVRVPENAAGISLMIPLPDAHFAWEDEPAPVSRRVIQGREFAAVRLPAHAGDRRLTARKRPDR